MTETKSRKPRTTKSGRAAKAVASLNGQSLKLLGSIVTLGSRSAEGRTHKYSEVVQALTDSDLDAKLAKEFLPKNAFSRACRKLAEERLIDLLGEDGDSIWFQFSKRDSKDDIEEGGKEFEYRKECKIRLDIATGKVHCQRDANVQEQAQTELDRCMDARTTSDITQIVRRLFDAYGKSNVGGDLIEIPGSIGVYFVPQEHELFLLKVEAFLGRLGRKPSRFPVPAGTQQGDSSVAEAVAEHLSGILAEHKLAVQSFSISTRPDTMEQAAERINNTRIKVQAYAAYLQDRSADLLVAVDEANAELVSQISYITEERKNAPPGTYHMSCDDAAVRCLEESGKPMTAQELVKAMDEAGYWSSTEGKTPHATVAARIYTEINEMGEKSRFVKHGRGVFTLKGS